MWEASRGGKKKALGMYDKSPYRTQLAQPGRQEMWGGGGGALFRPEHLTPQSHWITLDHGSHQAGSFASTALWTGDEPQKAGTG